VLAFGTSGVPVVIVSAVELEPEFESVEVEERVLDIVIELCTVN